MKRGTLFCALSILLLLLCAACSETTAEPPTTAYRAEAERLANAQLGVLAHHISPAERERVVEQLETLVPLRARRMEENRHEKTPTEARLVGVLNRLYERYTIKYLEDGGTWGYTSPTERELGRYLIAGGDAIRPDPNFTPRPGGGYTEADMALLWTQMVEMLPDGAFEDFERFTVFTDGADETLAYVVPTDDEGKRWEIAVDPADADDWVWFAETVLHEYTHYITLNDTQVDYPGQRTALHYSEDWLAAREDSYLDNFYRTFWVDTLDDRLADMDSYNFYLRHQDDFVSAYASTDPSEDIAESFAYYLLWDTPTGDAVWEQKLRFFTAYPALVSFRQQVRQQMDYLP